MEGMDFRFFTVIQCLLKDFTILALRKRYVFESLSSQELTVSGFLLSKSNFGI